MKTVELLCRQVYEWNKRDLWVLSSICIIPGLIVHFYDPHYILKMATIVFLLFKMFTYTSGASVMPSNSADTHQFSWKYIQSMPLNKKEIFAFLMFSNLLAYLPLWIWFASFQGSVLDLFDVKIDGVFTLVKIHLGIFLTMLLITLWGLSNVIDGPRRQFSRKNENLIFYEYVKNIAIGFCSIVYLVCFFYYLYVEHDINILNYIDRLVEFLDQKVFADRIKGWGTPLIFFEILFIAFYARKVIVLWQDESRSYRKINWNAKRDVPIIICCLVLVVIPFNSNYMTISHYFRTDPLLKAAAQGKMSKTTELIQAGAKVDLSNQYGATVLMAAAENGDLEYFKFLERLGASREGILSYKKINRDLLEVAIKAENLKIALHLLKTGFNPRADVLNKSKFVCNTELIDLLVDKGIDLSQQDKNGNTILHKAAIRNCFGIVAVYLEKGYDPNIRNREGKIALDVLSNPASELAYYLRKNSRIPAGKK